jgi:hypothetical protein
LSSKEELKREASAVRKSCCFFCHQNCGVLAYVKDGRVLAIEEDPEHPVSRGGLCARGNIALQHLNHPARINVPHVRRDAVNLLTYPRVNSLSSLQVSLPWTPIYSPPGWKSPAAPPKKTWSPPIP